MQRIFLKSKSAHLRFSKIKVFYSRQIKCLKFISVCRFILHRICTDVASSKTYTYGEICLSQLGIGVNSLVRYYLAVRWLSAASERGNKLRNNCHLDDIVTESVQVFKLLGVHIAHDLLWADNSDVISKTASSGLFPEIAWTWWRLS